MPWKEDDVCKTFTPGRRVAKIEVGDAGAFLRFTFNDGAATFVAFGDCCSHTWVNDLIGVAALLGQVVTSCVVKDVRGDALEDEDEDGDHEVIQHYGYTITTPMGYFDLLFRNSSNGYYGGSLELVEDENASWWRGKPDDETKWKVVTEDWSADGQP